MSSHLSPTPAAPPAARPSGRASGRPSGWFWLPALAGLAAVLAGFGLAELTAGLIAPGASPVLVVGALLIDLAPPPVKELVIGLFGTADKVALIVFIALVATVLAALAGILEYRRPPFGRFVVVIAGLVALVAALTRAGASPFDAVPPVLAMVVAALVLRIGRASCRERVSLSV